MRWALLWVVVATAAPLRAQVCALRGQNVEVKVRIDVGDGLAIQTFAETIGVIVRNGVGRAKVVGPLAFAAEVDPSDLPLSISNDHVTTTPALRWARSRGDEVEVEAELQCEEATFTTTCDGLRIGGVEALPALLLQGSPWSPRRRRLTLYDAPGGRPIAVVGRVSLFRLRERDGWMQVGARDSQVTIRAWARPGTLVPARRPQGRCVRTPRVRAGWAPEMRYAATARLRPGTVIHDAPDGEPWAHTLTSYPYIVRVQPGAPWAQLVTIPDMRVPRDFQNHAWVRREKVLFLIRDP